MPCGDCITKVIIGEKDVPVCAYVGFKRLNQCISRKFLYATLLKKSIIFLLSDLGTIRFKGLKISCIDKDLISVPARSFIANSKVFSVLPTILSSNKCSCFVIIAVMGLAR